MSWYECVPSHSKNIWNDGQKQGWDNNSLLFVIYAKNQLVGQKKTNASSYWFEVVNLRWSKISDWSSRWENEKQKVTYLERHQMPRDQNRERRLVKSMDSRLGRHEPWWCLSRYLFQNLERQSWYRCHERRWFRPVLKRLSQYPRESVAFHDQKENSRVA